MVGFQIRAGQQMPTSSAELPAEGTAASRFWLEPPGWVPSRRLARSLVPRHGSFQIETHGTEFRAASGMLRMAGKPDRPNKAGISGNYNRV